VRYALQDNTLRIEYRATTDKDTVLNLTNHSYFNLSGQGSGDVLKDQVTIHASKYTPVDKNLIPTGQISPVAGTPFDFTKGKPVGQDIDGNNEQLKLGLGYDHNFVLENGGSLKSVAMVVDPNSGRTLEVWTDQPGVQFYTGNHLDGTVKGKGGHAYAKREALCLETQHFPDSPNEPHFPSVVLRPGEELRSQTVFAFSVDR
jgi:aldose 1-epimerase